MVGLHEKSIGELSDHAFMARMLKKYPRQGRSSRPPRSSLPPLGAKKAGLIIQFCPPIGLKIKIRPKMLTSKKQGKHNKSVLNRPYAPYPGF